MTPVCKAIRKLMLDITHQSGHGHLPTCFSIVELLFSVYSAMKHDPLFPSWEERDIFILSKGHGALAHYCVLAEFGYFNRDEIYSFGAFMSKFGCHADRLKVPGVEVSTGSLGHGLGVAVGVALAFKIKNSPRRVFVIVGDGEANEGTVWEAVMVAVNLTLDNLTIIYDNNLSQTRGLQIYNPGERFHAFGCEVHEVNGHHLEDLTSILLQKNKSQLVKVVIANTQKGFGCETLVNNHHEWHRKSPTQQELPKLLEELENA
jgi:transketolase